MKIVHICISAPYIDGWGYQENLLPEYLHNAGTDNYVISSNINLPAYLNEETKTAIVKKGRSYKVGNVSIYKIDGIKVTSSLFISFGLMKKLEEIKPDIIFHHNVSFTTLPIVSKYAKKYNCKLFVDNHADEINMSKNKLWILLYYKFLSRIACCISKKYITKFYGVTNSRCDFINKYYGVPKRNIELLPIGADTDLADALLPKIKLREKYDFPKDEIIIINGGKMGVHKGTNDLINAIEELNSQNRIRLILFGKFEDEGTFELANSKNFISILGWCNRQKTLELLKLSDVACWPIHHTTLIEDCISVETPIVIRKTGTTEHLIDGNGIWLKNGNKDELIDAIGRMINQIDNNGNLIACKKMKNELSYNNIAQIIINTAKKIE